MLFGLKDRWKHFHLEKKTERVLKKQGEKATFEITALGNCELWCISKTYVCPFLDVMSSARGKLMQSKY